MIYMIPNYKYIWVSIFKNESSNRDLMSYIEPYIYKIIFGQSFILTKYNTACIVKKREQLSWTNPIRENNYLLGSHAS